MGKEFSLEQKWEEEMARADTAPPLLPDLEEEAPTPVAPQVMYGIHLVMLSDGNPHVELTGSPTYPQILRMLREVEINMTAEMTAERVVNKLRNAQRKIVT